MFKKILSVITACALLCLCFTVFVSAGSSTCSASMTYELDNSGVLLVTVTFTDIDDESGVVAVSSNVRFDSEILEYVGFEQDYPKEWGDYGDSWTCLAENDPSLIKLTYLFDSAEEGHGAQGDFSTVLKFNVLRTGVETVITATENSVTNDLLMIIPAPDVTLTLTVKDGGNVDGDVSVGEASEPESDDTSKSEEESKSEGSVRRLFRTGDIRQHRAKRQSCDLDCYRNCGGCFDYGCSDCGGCNRDIKKEESRLKPKTPRIKGCFFVRLPMRKDRSNANPRV